MEEISIMKTSKWSKRQEAKFKGIVGRFFDRKINAALAHAKNPLEVGDSLASVLKSSDGEIVNIVTPRAVKKWASIKTRPKWDKLLQDPRMVSELRVIGRSIANTMRPLAGNTFALWVARILNEYFAKNKIPLKAVTSGPVKTELGKSLVRRVRQGTRDYKPDIDVILVRTDLENKPIAIISAKTTLAERVMQTISWSRYVKVPVFLVTAWETFRSGTNRDRVQELDGVYVCNGDVKEYGKIKQFSKIAGDLKKFY